jgi:lysozyme family protein
MARETLPIALQLIFGAEGGYSNAATDSGGPTKYGITYRTLAAHDGISEAAARSAVKALSLVKAEEIYRAGFWTQSGGDLLPRGLDYAAFDFGVNSGPARAVRTLQQLVGAPADGNCGPETLKAVKTYPGGLEKLIRDYCDARMRFLRSLTNRKTGFPVNGRGWTIRVTGKDPKGQWKPQPGVVGNALRLAATPASAPSTLSPEPIRAPMDGGDAKAVPPAPNPWKKPETLLQALPALGGLAFLADGSGPVQWAVGAALLIAAGTAAYFIVRRIRRTPA